MRHVVQVFHRRKLAVLLFAACCACAPAIVLAQGTHVATQGSGNGLRLIESTTLWMQPLANQRTPRMQAKQLWREDDGESFQDVTLGGTLPLVGWDYNHTSFQFAVSGAVYSRFESFGDLMAEDYLGAVQLFGYTAGVRWRLAYEQLSAHLGDEFIAESGRERSSYYRDEVVVGLSAPLVENLRTYFQFGQAFNAYGTTDPTRFNYGFEWLVTQPFSTNIVPFVATDFEYRSEQGYDPNSTIQVGVLRRQPSSGKTLRFAGEYYSGNSPFGQFFQEEEDSVGLILAFSY